MLFSTPFSTPLENIYYLCANKGNQKIILAMAKLESKSKENPRLEQRLLADGQISLYLEYYLGRESEPVLDEFGEPVLYESGKMKGTPKFKVKHIRRKEKLNLYLMAKPRTPIERQHNKDTLQLAKNIRQEREQQFSENRDGYRLKKKEEVNLLDYFNEFAEQANVKDRLVLVGALKNFRTFLAEEYPQFANRITAKNLSKEMIEKFVAFLVDNHKGQGAETYYRRFKRMINYATEKGVIQQSPCKGVTTPKVDDMLAKDILSAEELRQLFATTYEGQNPEIRRAFAMTCLTGIRRCDLVGLTYSNVDYANRKLSYRQSKTQKKSSSSGVVVPLTDELLELIGTKDEAATDDYIFHIPSDTMCLKALRVWTKKAGISKHITWHCGRHSFATMLLSNGANIKTVSSLLGHSTLKFTEIYVRAVDKLKEEALNTLPKINI